MDVEKALRFFEYERRPDCTCDRCESVKTLQHLSETLPKVREALEFYANNDNWQWFDYERHYNDANGHSCTTTELYQEVDADSGQRAKEALRAMTGPAP